MASLVAKGEQVMSIHLRVSWMAVAAITALILLAVWR